MQKYQNFLSENFQCLVVKFSVYLNTRVFVMIQQNSSVVSILLGNIRENLSSAYF